MEGAVSKFVSHVLGQLFSVAPNRLKSDDGVFDRLSYISSIIQVRFATKQQFPLSILEKFPRNDAEVWYMLTV